MNYFQLQFLELACYLSRRAKNGPGHWRLVRWLKDRVDVSELPARPRSMAAGQMLFIDPRDLDGRRYLVHGLSPAEPISRLFRKVLRSGDLVVDVGANVGYFSILASMLVGPRGRVVSIEASPQIAARLRVLERNRIGNVQIHESAISDSEGTVDFYLGPSNHTGLSSLRDMGSGTTNRVSVASRTLDSMLKDNGPVRLIKVDVEGAEYGVLSGAKEILARDRPYLIVEITPSFLRSFGRSPADIVELAAELGYECWRIGNRRERFVALSEEEFQCDILMAPRGSETPAR